VERTSLVDGIGQPPILDDEQFAVDEPLEQLFATLNNDGPHGRYSPAAET
jgi:hypothetical protein